jgi:cation:H+ antiporter
VSIFTFLMLVVGLVLLIGGAELLVRGAAALATAAGVTPLVVGLTVVSFGTSSPELAVSLQSAFSGQADLAIGNVIGSNIFNILVILGLAALVTPLTVAFQLIRIDVPIMVGISLLLGLLAWNGNLGRLEGLLLALGLAGYLTFTVIQVLREGRPPGEDVPDKPHGGGRQLLINLGLVIAGLLLLIFGSNWLVDSAVTIARAFGVSELVIGLTIIATGTSLPEVAATLAAALKGERDMAVGNAVGSNIFNILGILGLTALFAPGGITVPATALTFDIPVMIAVAIACLPIFFSDYTIARWEGGLFVAYYAIYLTFVFLAATGSPWASLFQAAVLGFVLPLTLITVAVTTLRAWRK